MLTNQYVIHALLPAVEMYQAFIDDSHDKPSLSYGSNAGMLQRNHPRLHCIHSMQCTPVWKPIHPAAGARHTTPHHCHARAFLFHSQTAKDIPSIVNGR